VREVEKYALGIPEFWYELPVGQPDQDKIAGIVAEALPDRGGNSVARDSLTSQLQELSTMVLDEVDDSSIAMVYIPAPENGDIGGVLTVQVRSDMTPKDYLEELLEWPLMWPEAEFLRNESVKTNLPGLQVEGAWVLLSVPTESDSSSHILQERMALGVFSDDYQDMIEVVCVSAYLGAFPDMGRQILAILTTLNVECSNA